MEYVSTHNFMRCACKQCINNCQSPYWTINAVLMTFEANKSINLILKLGSTCFKINKAWAAVRSKAVVLLLLTFCLLLLPLWESVIVLCFVMRYVMAVLVLQSS